MRQNQKLTNVLHGKVVTALKTSRGLVHIQFQDGFTMVINGRLNGDVPEYVAKGVAVVRDDEQDMTVELDAGTTLRFVVSEPGGSVVVRDAHDTVTYAG